MSGRLAESAFLKAATSVLVIGCDARPLLRRQLGGFLRQHRRLHGIGGPQTEGVAVALRPGDRVGQRLGGKKEDLLLLREVGDREADIGKEGAHQHRDLVALHELIGCGDRLRRLAAVVLGDHDELLAVGAALRIDLLERQLPAFTVGLGERRQARIGIDFANLDVVGPGGTVRRREPCNHGCGDAKRCSHDALSSR